VAALIDLSNPLDKTCYLASNLKCR